MTAKMAAGMSYEEPWEEIDELIDRLDGVEDKLVPPALQRQIQQLAQRMYESGRYTSLRAAELAVSSIYLKERYRPAVGGLPCHPKRPSMLCCRPEIQIEIRSSGVTARGSTKRRTNTARGHARCETGTKQEGSTCSTVGKQNPVVSG
jgi:hypothetical protein